MGFWGQSNLCDPGSFLQEEFLLFHDHVLVVLIGILSFVFLMGLRLVSSRFSCSVDTPMHKLEIIWTVAPAIVLVFLAVPSLRLLYLADTDRSSGLILKVMGHQWYWEYELPALGLSFDSYMLKSADLTEGQYRLLDVDNRVTLPYQVDVLALVSSADVLHSWAVPSCGLKVDAVPGRLNSCPFMLMKPGVYYGQCSEICGANHSFMPIVLEGIPLNEWTN